MISCKAKTPYNPYLKAKDKPSASITDERKKMEKGALKKTKNGFGKIESRFIPIDLCRP